MSEVPEAPMTGDEVVDEALREVARLAERPLEEAAPVLRRAQERLQEFLSSADNAA